MSDQTRQGQWRAAARQALEAFGATGLTDAHLTELESCHDGDGLWEAFDEFAGDWGQDFDWDGGLDALEALQRTH